MFSRFSACRDLRRTRRLPLFLASLSLAALPLPSLAAVCDNFYPAGFQLTQGKLNPATVSMSKPAKGVQVGEPNFGTCMVRATDHANEPPSRFARNDYSRRQAFNADNSYFLIYSHDGSWHLYDAGTLAHVRVLTPLGGDAEPQWHPTDPNTLYYVPINGGTKLLKVDVRNNASSTAVDFAGRLPSWASTGRHIWTRSEGSPSADGRYWGFIVQDDNWKVLGYIVWDLVQNQLAGSRQATVQYPDNVSISAKGNWFVTSDETGVWAWSRDFARKAKIANDGGVHTDLGIGANGNDYFVSVDYQSSAGDVYAVDLDACPTVAASASTTAICPRMVLFSMYTEGGWATLHFSTKSFNRPGWALISTYDTDSNSQTLPWFREKIFAIEMKANPRIYPIAYTRRVRVTSGDTDGASNYWAEPHATVNRDFTRIMFNTNWGNSVGADVDAYMIKLPTTALGGGGGASGPRMRTGGNQAPVPAQGSNGIAAASASRASATPLAQSSGSTTPAGAARSTGAAKALWQWLGFSTTSPLVTTLDRLVDLRASWASPWLRPLR